MGKGVIYILTNPSFPQYVKIGYATDVKQRLDELNRSTAVPFAFRVYATYEVDSALSDKKLHSILDKLNPELRSTEEVDGKRRIREFYAMTPETAYGIFETIAELGGRRERLHLYDLSEEEKDSVIKDYLDSLDIKQKELDKQIDEDEDLSKVRDAIDFMKSVATGETKLENIEESN
jgi:hypothetical protein